MKGDTDFARTKIMRNIKNFYWIQYFCWAATTENFTRSGFWKAR